MRISDWSSDVCSSDLHEKQPPLLQLRLQGFADFPFPVGQLCLFGIAARRQIGPDFSLAGHSVDRACDFAVDQHDSLVAACHFLDECLHHEGFDPHLPEQFGERGKVRAIRADTRSEEHTSELQSLMRISYAVFCLKKQKYT